jgi:hypothetical protein
MTAKMTPKLEPSEVIALDARCREAEARHMLTLADLAKRAEATRMRAYDNAFRQKAMLGQSQPLKRRLREWVGPLAPHLMHWFTSEDRIRQAGLRAANWLGVIGGDARRSPAVGARPISRNRPDSTQSKLYRRQPMKPHRRDWMTHPWTAPIVGILLPAAIVSVFAPATAPGEHSGARHRGRPSCAVVRGPGLAIIACTLDSVAAAQIAADHRPAHGEAVDAH